MNAQKGMELSSLLKFGITEEKIELFDIICFPENLSAVTNENELYDASDSITLAKKLKSIGVKCANSFDLGLHPQIFERRSKEKWFGVVYLRSKVAIPFFVSVISGLLVHEIVNQPTSGNDPVPKVHIELKIEKTNNITTLKYDGDAKTLLQVLNNLVNEVSEEE